MRAMYAVARHACRKATGERGALQAELTVSKYRGLDEPQDEVAEYTEVDEAALDRRRKSLCTTPEVSEAFSEEPPPTPPPRASVSSGTFEAPPPASQGRAPAVLPPGEDGDDDPAVPSTSRRADLLKVLQPPLERSISSPAVILEEEEDEIDDDYGGEVGVGGGDEDAYSQNDLYSEVIEDEDLYVTVPADWDGDGDGRLSLGSRCSEWTDRSATPVPAARPHRPPAQVIVIRETDSGFGPPAADANGEPAAPRPPDDLPDERPVPRLYVQCLPCCACCLTGELGHAGFAASKEPPNSPGNRMLALALLLFTFLVGLLLVNLAILTHQQSSSSSTTQAATSPAVTMSDPTSLAVTPSAPTSTSDLQL